MGQYRKQLFKRLVRTGISGILHDGLSELNALLNMDEREDTETEQSESKEKEERPVRGSIHEKLQIYKEKSQRESETGKETRKWDFGLE